MRVAAGIITWQDGSALENTLRSVAPVVDEILVADGLIDGIDADGLDPFTPPEELNRVQLVYGAKVRQSRWPSQSAQRQWTLDQARALECDWLLAIDADEELRNGAALRAWLEVWRWDAFPIPFYFTDNQEACPAAFKCLHVPDWQRYVCQGSMLENQAGETVQLIGQSWWSGAREAKMPYLVHRPELRPPGRRTIRLSEHETRLEPQPDNVKVWRDPVYAPRLYDPDPLIPSSERAAELGLPVWYCPGCGRRYTGPGSCTFQHQPVGLEPVQVARGAAA